MIGVALVGFITIFAASAKASINAQVDEAFKSRLRDQHRLRLRCRLRRAQPAAGERHRQAAAGRRRRARSGSTRPSSTARASSSRASIPRSATKVFNLKVAGRDRRRPRPGQQRRHLAAQRRRQALAAREPGARRSSRTAPRRLTVRTIYGNGNKQGFADYYALDRDGRAALHVAARQLRVRQARVRRQPGEGRKAHRPRPEGVPERQAAGQHAVQGRRKRRRSTSSWA